jgi:hypothetical protein
MRFPQINRVVNAFLLGEEGKIPKSTLLKVGAVAVSFLGAAAINSKLAEAIHYNSTVPCGHCNAEDTCNPISCHAAGGHGSQYCAPIHSNNLQVNFAQFRLDALHSHSLSAAQHCSGHANAHNAWHNSY